MRAIPFSFWWGQNEVKNVAYCRHRVNKGWSIP